MLKFPKYFLLKFKQELNISHFVPVDVKKIMQQIGLEYCLFSHIVKIRRKIVRETDTASINKNKTKE